MAISVGIAGISGFTGAELMRLLHAHPGVRLVAASAGSHAGRALSEVWPGAQDVVELPLLPLDTPGLFSGCELVFLALPHGVSAGVAHGLLAAGKRVIDLGADFRIRDPGVYAADYGPHPFPELLADAVYGLPELNRDRIRDARLVANPGCYPTATAIAALPIVEDGLADWLIADCLSGVSGAGRSLKAASQFCAASESVVAYGVAGAHRHSAEMEQTLGVPVTFTPHLVPMRRGMLATVHARVRGGVDGAQLLERYRARYADHPAVTVTAMPPSSGQVRGTARAAVSVAFDAKRGVITAMCAIDNLGKGAAGQAVHNLNLMLGLPETTGLPALPLFP